MELVAFGFLQLCVPYTWPRLGVEIYMCSYRMSWFSELIFCKTVLIWKVRGSRSW